MQDHALLPPPHIERLIGPELFVAEQRLALVGLHQRRIGVERRHGLAAMPLEKCDERKVDAPQPRQCLARHRHERLADLAFGFLRRIVELDEPL